MCALPERALYWPSRAMLLVADPHWGKAAAFRAGGLAVPEAGTSADLERLGRALAATGAERLVFLGDFWHARAGRSSEVLDALRRWRERHCELTVELVRGNHDRHAGDPPEEFSIRSVEAPFDEAPFRLAHFPEPDPSGYVLAGHLHPAVHLRGAGRGRERLRLPCFHFGPQVGVLPAFGSFTGHATVRPAAGDRVLVVADERVIEIS